MLYDEDTSPEDRLKAAGMPAAPDAQYAQQWSSIEVSLNRKCFLSDFTCVDHPSRAADQLLHAKMLKQRPPTTALFESWRKETIDFSTAKSNRAVPVVTEVDKVLGGPPHLYSEPRIFSKKNLFLNRNPHAGGAVTPRPAPYPMTHRNASVRMEWVTRSKARKDCEDAMQGLVKKTSHFVDCDFFIGEASALFPRGTARTSTVGEPRDVKSLRSMYPSTALVAPLSDQILVPGRCATQHLVTAVDCIVKEHPEGEHVIHELFVAPRGTDANSFFAQHGFIGVLLFTNGWWEWTIVDDLVAIDENADLLFMKLIDRGQLIKMHKRYQTAPPNAASANTPARVVEPYIGMKLLPPACLWPMMLEKAFAKIHGSMDAIDSGVARETIATLTSAMEVGSASMEDALDSTAETGIGSTLLIAHTDDGQASFAVPLLHGGGNNGELPNCWSSLYLTPSAQFERKAAEFPQVEVLRFRPSDDVVVEVCDTSALEQQPPCDYQIVLTAPLRAAVMISVEQADPKTQMHLPHELRKILPYLLAEVRVVNSAGAVVFVSEKVCRRQVSVTLPLEPAAYTIRASFTGGPPVPFTLTVSSNSSATLSIVRLGQDMAIHGVTTRSIEHRRAQTVLAIANASAQQAATDVCDGIMLLHAQPDAPPGQASPAAAPGAATDVSTALLASQSFSAADILQKGKLDERGCRRAFLDYVLQHASVGRRFEEALAEALSQQQGGGPMLTPQNFERVLLKCGAFEL